MPVDSLKPVIVFLIEFSGRFQPSLQEHKAPIVIARLCEAICFLSRKKIASSPEAPRNDNSVKLRNTAFFDAENHNLNAPDLRPKTGAPIIHIGSVYLNCPDFKIIATVKAVSANPIIT
jgi:hypothetical protein